MGRAPCCDKTSVKRGPWSLEEDSKLKDYIEKHGAGGNWIALPHKAGLNRCGKSCRLRWLNYLRPNIKHGDFSDEEDRIICSLYVNIGSRWSIIAAQLPGRTDNDIKNYWNTKLKKKLMGLLPITTHHHRKLPFPSNSFHQNQPTSPSSIIYTTDYCGHTSFTSLEPISLPSNNNNNYANTCCTATTTSVSLPPFYQNQDVSLSLPMQYDYSMRDNMLMFGSEGSCNSSSDGSSCKEIKQEEMGYQSYIMSTGFEDYNNNNFMLSCNQYAENSGGVGCTSQTLSPLDYSLEDINQLISSSSNSSNSGFNIDENKMEEKAMYCYYYL